MAWKKKEVDEYLTRWERSKKRKKEEVHGSIILIKKCRCYWNVSGKVWSTFFETGIDQILKQNRQQFENKTTAIKYAEALKRKYRKYF